MIFNFVIQLAQKSNGDYSPAYIDTFIICSGHVYLCADHFPLHVFKFNLIEQDLWWK